MFDWDCCPTGSSILCSTGPLTIINANDYIHSTGFSKSKLECNSMFDWKILIWGFMFDWMSDWNRILCLSKNLVVHNVLPSQ
jgi:hypothetical protein